MTPRADLAALKRGDRVTVLDADGHPVDIITIRGVLVAGRLSTGEIGRTRYWNVGRSEGDGGRTSIRPYAPKDEERVIAATWLTKASENARVATNAGDYVRTCVRRNEEEGARLRVAKNASEVRERETAAALAEARTRLAEIGEVA